MEINWSPQNIFDYRVKLLSTTAGKFYIGTNGKNWTLYTWDYKRTALSGIDVLTMCHWLNDHRAELAEKS